MIDGGVGTVWIGSIPPSASPTLYVLYITVVAARSITTESGNGIDRRANSNFVLGYVRLIGFPVSSADAIIKNIMKGRREKRERVLNYFDGLFIQCVITVGESAEDYCT